LIQSLQDKSIGKKFDYLWKKNLYKYLKPNSL
jgi:hypothetical protein